MSVKTTLFILTIAVIGLGALLSAVPGNPIWRIFNPSRTVAFAPEDASALRNLEIVTLLSKDAIPAIFDPTFVAGAAADRQMRPQDRIIGLSINGDNRAYSIGHLSSHEVVNDTVGGIPVAVTW